MTPNLQFRILEMILTQIFLGGFVYLLTDFRAPQSRWKKIWLAILLATVFANGVIICVYGYESLYSQIWPFTMTLPYVLNTLLVSKTRGFRTLFNIGTALYVGAIAVLTAMLIQYFWPFYWVQLPIRVVALAGSIPVIYRLRKPYLKMLTMMESGWIAMCAIPFFITVFSCILIQQFIILKDPLCILFIYLMLACGMCIYYMIYRFFIKVLEEQSALHAESILRLQVAVSQDNLRISKRNEKNIAAFRKQFMSWIDRMEKDIIDGDLPQAMDSLSDIEAMQISHISRYCREPVLNAVFSVYEQQAGKDGTDLSIQANLSSMPNINTTELAVVISNALSNAIEACQAAPAGKPRIISVLIKSQGDQVAAEIRNTCYAPVNFDKNGLPISEKGEGHGIGTKSMTAFAQHTGAFMTFEEKDGWFTVRMLV